jgi:hypothetical protein
MMEGKGRHYQGYSPLFSLVASPRILAFLYKAPTRKSGFAVVAEARYSQEKLCEASFTYQPFLSWQWGRGHSSPEAALQGEDLHRIEMAS